MSAHTEAEAYTEEIIEPSPTESPELVLSSESSNHRKRKADPRHVPFREKLEKFWAWKNPDLPPFAWGVADAKQLSDFLKRWPELTEQEFARWLLHYSKSEDITPSKTPRQFLPFIHDYASGPRNKFHNPKEEKHSVL
jgi:hypothetical protein